MKKINEKAIIRDGKMTYAVCIESISEENSNIRNTNKTFIYIKNGEIYFSDSMYNSANEYDLSDEAHKIAKEIFVSQLRTSIKTKVLELKQLEEIFNCINMPELLEDKVLQAGELLSTPLKSGSRFLGKAKEILGRCDKE